MKSYNSYEIIRRPLITEKSTSLGEDRKYVFEVAKGSFKASIKKAVEQIFEVKVKSVNILNQKGKVKKFKGIKGRRSDLRKAIVTLEKDHVIDLAGGIK
jgi:large subunit ribosomal protein L23